MKLCDRWTVHLTHFIAGDGVPLTNGGEAAWMQDSPAHWLQCMATCQQMEL